MARRNTITFLIILVIFAFTLWVLLPIQGERFGRKGMHLGLDLVGGVSWSTGRNFQKTPLPRIKAPPWDG